MRIRHAIETDRDFILGLAGRFAEFEVPSWRTCHDIVNGTATRLDDALRNQNERSRIIIAEDEGTPLGFAWLTLLEDFYTRRDLAKINEIAVTRDGTGAGSILMKAGEDWARGHGCDLIVLNVVEGNERARRFYERHGYAAEHSMLAKIVEAKEQL